MAGRQLLRVAMCLALVASFQPQRLGEQKIAVRKAVSEATQTLEWIEEAARLRREIEDDEQELAKDRAEPTELKNNVLPLMRTKIPVVEDEQLWVTTVRFGPPSHSEIDVPFLRAKWQFLKDGAVRLEECEGSVLGARATDFEAGWRLIKGLKKNGPKNILRLECWLALDATKTKIVKLITTAMPQEMAVAARLAHAAARSRVDSLETAMQAERVAYINIDEPIWKKAFRYRTLFAMAEKIMFAKDFEAAARRAAEPARSSIQLWIEGELYVVSKTGGVQLRASGEAADNVADANFDSWVESISLNLKKKLQKPDA